MVALEKRMAHTLIIVIFSMIYAYAHAESLDDVINYQAPPPPAAVKAEGQPPYTIQDIINKIPGTLNDEGELKTYGSYWFDSQDPGAIAFDRNNFGGCNRFFILSDRPREELGKGNGWRTFYDTLSFLFSDNEKQKEKSRDDLKSGLAALSSEDCYYNPRALANYKEIINAVIQAAPAILQEKRRLAAEKQANMLATEKAEQAHTTCINSSKHKLYESSHVIEVNNLNISYAKNKIQQQEEGEKISGFVDKRVMYEMGNTIAQANRSNAELFGVYKQSGGTAKSVELVRTTSPSDPCEK